MTRGTTALKLNNMTHESFAIEEVISDSLFRARPIKIANYNFRFAKHSKKLLDFGTEKRNGLEFSDPEKRYWILSISGSRMACQRRR